MQIKLKKKRCLLQIATNWSFNKIAGLAGIEKQQVMRIFWIFCRAHYRKGLSIPKISDQQDEMESIFQNIYDSTDLFYRELFKFRDPLGEVFYT